MFFLFLYGMTKSGKDKEEEEEEEEEEEKEEWKKRQMKCEKKTQDRYHCL